ncbi:MAG: choline/ethanolamine kinase family protein [Erysipelotrichaceae bacterium]
MNKENYNIMFNDEIKNIIKESLGNKDINNIEVMKAGMTNDSFIFKNGNERYVFRFPGDGTEFLINRENEKAAYAIIENKNICDAPIYINEKNGYKISKYIENVRVCNPYCDSDLKLCMDKLREFHSLKLKVDFHFDIYERLEFYQSLWQTEKSAYIDYEDTKRNVLKLKQFIKDNVEEIILCHIDAVSDNFLIYKDSDGNELVQLNDWEYAGMQDPDVDVAMFCIYSMLDKEEIDNVINIYFNDGIEYIKKLKIYAYIALCGLLWSNWCEFKIQLGFVFGEYAPRQYYYAKEFYKIVKSELTRLGLNENYGI